MNSPDLSRLEEARQLFSRFFPPSPLISAPYLTRISNCEVYLKLESALPTGSFKPRGALFALNSKLLKGSVIEVVTSSTGNHGAAVAYAARQLGVPATIFLPEHPNPVKRATIANLGARIVESGNNLNEAFAAATAYARKDGVYLLDDAVDPDIPVGTATIASEIFEQLPDAQLIYVPVGDTALIRGIAAVAATRPGRKIIGVQAERAPAYYSSWKSGSADVADICDTIADGLATNRPVQSNVDDIRGLVAEMRLVTEDEMLSAIRCLLLEEKIMSEPAGAAATAAFLQSDQHIGNGKVVLIVSGKNLPNEIRARALATGTPDLSRIPVT